MSMTELKALLDTMGVARLPNTATAEQGTKADDAQPAVAGKGLSSNDYTNTEKTKVQASTDRVKVYANTAAVTYTSTTLAAVAGLSFTADAGASYEVEILVKHTSALATGAMALGLAALPTGAKQKLAASVLSGNYSKALLVSGDTILASSSLVSALNLSRITGLIEIGTTGGTIQVMAGAGGIAPNISLAIGDATMRVTRVTG